MNQPGKLDTIAPTLREMTAVVGPAGRAASPETEGMRPADGSARPGPADGSARPEPTEISIDIVVEKNSPAGIALFSVQNLLTLMPGWSVSFAGHAILLILLTVIVTSPVKDGSSLQLEGLMSDGTTVSVIQDIVNEDELTESDLLQVDVAALNSEASTETALILHEEGFDVSLTEGFSDGIGIEAMSQTGLTPIPNQDRGGVQGSTDDTSTHFFGTRATGSRFVFIIDASDSMNEGFRWHQAVKELERSIGNLNEDQRALVLVYNFQTFPMMDIPPRDLKLMSVSENFKKALSNWLEDQIPTGGTRPAHALRYSLSLQPDAIFLLSDGMLADNSIQVLANENTPREMANGEISKIPVHTISLGPNEAGAELMKLIAEHNDGEFNWVRN